MLQEKTARTPNTLRVADVVRTYIPQVGYWFYFDMLLVCTRMHERESTARHSSTARTTKKKPIVFGRKIIPVPSRVIFFCLIRTPRKKIRNAKKQTEELFSQPSYVARPSRDHLATDSVRVKLSSISATVGPAARFA